MPVILRFKKSQLYARHVRLGDLPGQMRDAAVALLESADEEDDEMRESAMTLISASRIVDGSSEISDMKTIIPVQDPSQATRFADEAEALSILDEADRKYCEAVHCDA